MIRPKNRILAIIVLMLGFIAISNGMKAQSTLKQIGKTFVESTDSMSNVTKTDYVYQDKKGNVDTIYLSKNGSAFIWKVSKKTGKPYRRYLPEVTKQLGTKKEDK